MLKAVLANPDTRLAVRWTVGTAAVAFCSAMIPLFIEFLMWGIVIFGLGALVLLLVFRLLKHRNMAAVQPVAVLALGTCLLLWSPFRESGAYVRAAYETLRYQSFWADVEAGLEPECPSSAYCCVERNKAALVWDGMIDNWLGLCFDPTHDLESVERNREIFGGDLIGSIHLWDNWYICSFT